jgi:hypothetical protein
MSERRFPPVIEVGVVTMVLVVASGIYLASHLPNHVALGLPAVLLALAGVCLVANLFMLTRIDGFAWDRFRTVGQWVLLAYVIISGMLEYTFLRNHTSGGPLVVLSLSLLLFALNVPLLVAFTVARYVPDD